MTKPEPREERLFLPDPEHDRIVVIVRAGCGALAGLFVAGVSWLNWYDAVGGVATILLFIGLPVAFAFLAVRHGDAFWERLRRNPFW